MTEIFNRRPRGARSRASARAMVALAAAAVVLPAVGATAAHATTGAASTHASIPVTYETGNLLVAKSGQWVKRNASGASQGNALVADGSKKQALTLTFTGSGVAVGYCDGPTDGYFSVYVDGKQITKVNSYNLFTACHKSIFINGLSATSEHRVVVQASAKRGAAHGASHVVIDYFTTH